MNIMELLAKLDSIGYHILYFHLSLLWQSSIVMIVVFLLSYLLRRKRSSVRHLIWVSSLLAIPLIPLITWIIYYLETPQIPIQVIPPYSSTQTKLSKLIEPPYKAEDSNANFTAVDEDIESITNVQSTNKHITQNNNKVNLSSYPLAIGMIVYIFGVPLFLIIMIYGRIRIKWWVINSSVVSEKNVIDFFERAGNKIGLRKDFVIVENTFIDAPMTIGTIHPVIVMPKGFINTLSVQEIYAIALHELSHVRRLDSLTLTLVSLIRAVFFFNPLVWFASHQISLLAEHACDDVVLDVTGESLSYAKMLTKIAEHLPKRSLKLELAAGIIFSRKSFLRRVEAILSNKRDQIRKLSKLAIIGTVTAAVLSIMVALALPLSEKKSDKDIITVSGKVLYEGKPIESANIHLKAITLGPYKDISQENIEKTKRDGSFRFTIPDSLLKSPYNAFRPYVIAYHEEYSLGWVQLTDEVDTENLTIILYKSATVSGKIIDTGGFPLKKVEVNPDVIIATGEIKFYGTNLITLGSLYSKKFGIQSDEYGNFILTNIPENGRVAVTARISEYVRKKIHAIPAGSSNIPITLFREGKITGRITVKDTGEPVSNIGVSAISENRNKIPGSDARTDENGYYTINNLLPSIYSVSVYETPEYTRANIYNIKIQEGDIVSDINMEIEKLTIPDEKPRKKKSNSEVQKSEIKKPKGVTLNGRVITANGSYLSSIKVDCTIRGVSESRYRSTTTRDDGTFTFYDLPEDRKMLITAEDEKKQLRGSVYFTSQTDADIEIVLRKYELVNVTGRVLDKKGIPVSGIDISIVFPHYFGQSDVSVTDTEGRFIIKGLATGDEYRITIFEQGYKEYLSEPFTVEKNMSPLKDIILTSEKY